MQEGVQTRSKIQRDEESSPREALEIVLVVIAFASLAVGFALVLVANIAWSQTYARAGLLLVGLGILAAFSAGTSKLATASA